MIRPVYDHYSQLSHFFRFGEMKFCARCRINIPNEHSRTRLLIRFSANVQDAQGQIIMANVGWSLCDESEEGVVAINFRIYEKVAIVVCIEYVPVL
jgi:hypothetical protein